MKDEPLNENELRMVCDFQPDATDLEKAVAAFEAGLAFRELVDALTDEHGLKGKCEWKHKHTTFDGPDVDAQPIYDALMDAYNKGLRAADAGKDGT